MNCTIISNRAELQLTGNEFEPPYTTVMAELQTVLTTLYQQGYNKFYLTAEWGIPLWASEVICSLKNTHSDISLCIVMPFESQAENWPEAIRDRYFHVHELADEVVMLNKHWHSDAEIDAIRYALNSSDLLYVFGNPSDNLASIKIAEDSGIQVAYITSTACL